VLPLDCYIVSAGAHKQNGDGEWIHPFTAENNQFLILKIVFYSANNKINKKRLIIN